jgi:hypothetical protein
VLSLSLSLSPPPLFYARAHARRYNAIKLAVGKGNDLTGFSVKSVTDGTTALGEVTIKIQPSSDGMGKRSVKGLVKIAGSSGGEAEAAAVEEEEEGEEGEGGEEDVARNTSQPRRKRLPTYSGVAADKDIIVASAFAYVAGAFEVGGGGSGQGAVPLSPLSWLCFWLLTHTPHSQPSHTPRLLFSSCSPQ